MVQKRQIMWTRVISVQRCLLIVLGIAALLFLINMGNFRWLRTLTNGVGDQDKVKSQRNVDYIAKYLDVRWTVRQNLHTYAEHLLTFKNTGSETISDTSWKIYFHHIRILEPVKELVDDRYKHNVPLGTSGLLISHTSGLLYYLFPDKTKFKPISPGAELIIPITSSHFQLSKYDVFPNWYVVAPGAEPKIIIATEGESISFVGPFERADQWKRSDKDHHNPYSAKDRYNLTKDTVDLKKAGKIIIPTPEEVQFPSDSYISVNQSEWVILSSKVFSSEAQYLSEMSGIKIADGPKTTKYIIFKNALPSSKFSKDEYEAYSLHVDQSYNTITITATSGHGIFNGIQSLLSLIEREDGSKKYKVKTVIIKDRPRFQYRGFMLDVSRNFHSKRTILRLIDLLAMYKINKLHLHLADDDGWRLEIPSIPELTELGSKRCHDESETVCLMPGLGSGPHKDKLGSGYYTVTDYQEILKYAGGRHIQIVPEIDMPSHMRAAILSLRKRQRDHPEEGDKFKFTDKVDGNEYRSAQGFNDNSANPCREGIYTFVDIIIKTIINIHRDIQPLTLFHFGGDEVPRRALKDMKCFMDLKDIKRYFVHRIVGNTEFHNLSYAAWEDGLLNEESEPYEPYNLFSVNNTNRDLYAFVWTEHNKALFRMANAGYKVINSRGAFLYFDHPYEPDPDERGLYWAVRFIDTQKVFKFDPLRGKEGYGELKKPENIVGIQAQLWTELVRTEEQLEYMAFPRLIALAERAWHKPAWLKTRDDKAKHEDWIQFANTLSYKEFPRLDKMGIKYRLPPPGAILIDGKLTVVTDYPGLPVEYSVDKQGQPREWKKVKGDERITERIVLRALSPDGKQHSREVSLKP